MAFIKPPRIPKMKNILNALELEDIPARAEFEAAVNANPHRVDFLESIDASFADPGVAAKFKNMAPGIFTNDETFLKSLYSETQTRIKANEYSVKFGANDKGPKAFYNNAKVTLKQTMRTIEHAANEGFKSFEQGILKNINASGFETKQAFEMLVKSPSKFKAAYNISQEEVMSHVFEGTKTGRIEVDNIIDTIKQADDGFIKGLQEQGTYIGKVDNYFMPFSIPRDAVDMLGEEEVLKLILTRTNVKENRAKELIVKLKDWKEYRSSNTSPNEFHLKTADFKSGTDAVEFFKEMNGLDAGENLLGHFLFHKQRTLKKAVMVNELGADPLSTLKNALDRAKRGIVSQKEKKRFDSLLKDFELRLKVYNGERFIDSPMAYQLSNTLNTMMSFVTGTPGRSAARNIMLDFEGNALKIGNSLYNGNFGIGKSAMRILNNFKYLIGQAVPSNVAKGGEKKEAIEAILDIMGFANSSDSIMTTNVASFEDVLDASVKGTSKTNAADHVAAFNNKLSRGMDTLYKISGNHATIDFARARKMISIQQMFTNVIKHKTYDDWLNSLEGAARAEADFMFKKFDFDEDMFNFLKEIKKTELNIGNDVADSLGFGNIPSFVSKEAILEASDDVAIKFKRKTESIAGAKQRWARNWQRFVYNSVNAVVPTTTIADSVTAPILHGVPAWAALTMRPFLKFVDPAAVQWSTLAERVALGVYGNTDKYIGFDRSLVEWGRAGGRYMAYGAALIWMKDVLNNRQPTDFRRKGNAVKLAALSGFGGAAVMMGAGYAGVFENRSSSSLAGTPAERLYTTGKRLAKSKSVGEGLSTLHKANPYSGLWYASGMVDFAINNVVLDKYDRDEKYENLERYGKPYIF